LANHSKLSTLSCVARRDSTFFGFQFLVRRKRLGVDNFDVLIHLADSGHRFIGRCVSYLFHLLAQEKPKKKVPRRSSAWG
jgi:hypothetical protein